MALRGAGSSAGAGMGEVAYLTPDTHTFSLEPLSPALLLLLRPLLRCDIVLPFYQGEDYCRLEYAVHCGS